MNRTPTIDLTDAQADGLQDSHNLRFCGETHEVTDGSSVDVGTCFEPADHPAGECRFEVNPPEPGPDAIDVWKAYRDLDPTEQRYLDGGR